MTGRNAKYKVPRGEKRTSKTMCRTVWMDFGNLPREPTPSKLKSRGSSFIRGKVVHSTEHSVEASVVQGTKCGAFGVRSSNQAPHHDSNEKNSAHYRCALLGMLHSATFPAKTRYPLRLLCGEIHSAHCIAGHGGKQLQRLMHVSHSFHVQILKQ